MAAETQALQPFRRASATPRPAAAVGAARPDEGRTQQSPTAERRAPESGAAEPRKAARDLRLDFFRGCALIFIFLDHIPDNAVSYVTLRSFAFCDAAEVFIFISGYTAALVYARAFDREGVAMGVARVYRRVWQLYVAHLCLFMIFNAEVAYTMKFLNNPLFADELQVADYLDNPGEAFIHVLLLQFQPPLLNILPLYIALLLILPLCLLAIRRHVLLALVPSAVLYGAVQVTELSMPGFPAGHHWYFNPFAWQFLFVAAATLGFLQTRNAPVARWTERLVIPAVAFALAAAAVRLSWMVHEVVPAMPAYIHLPAVWFEKTDLRLPRLISLFALVLVTARFVPRDARFLSSRLGWLIVLTGQNSLYVFCLTILLDVGASFVISLTDGAILPLLAVNAAGVLIMFGMGLLLAWFKAGGRLPRRPTGIVPA